MKKRNDKYFNQFMKFKHDECRWDWVLKNQDKGIIVMLDDDATFCVFKNEIDDAEGYILEFDSCIGNSNGIFNLFNVLKIKCDGI